MPGKPICFILTLVKAAASKAAKSKTSVITIAKMMAAKWCFDMKTESETMEETTSFKIKSPTCFLWAVTPRMSPMDLNVQMLAPIGKWALTIIANG